MRAILGAALASVLVLGGVTAAGACATDADCGCAGDAICFAGACMPMFTLPVFPVGAPETRSC